MLNTLYCYHSSANSFFLTGSVEASRLIFYVQGALQKMVLVLLGIGFYNTVPISDNLYKLTIEMIGKNLRGITLKNESY